MNIAKFQSSSVFTLTSVVLICLCIMACAEKKSDPKFTEEQVRIANQYWSKTIHDLRNLGLIKDIKTEGKTLIIYMDGKLWKGISYEQKKSLLNGVSETNEVRGGTPWVTFRDFNSGKIYGEVKPPITADIYE